MFISFLGMLGLLSLGVSTYATNLQDSEYFYFYGQGCSHCIKVEHYFEQSKVDKKIQISAHEIWYDQEGLKTLESMLPQVNLSLEQIGTPFLIIKSAEGNYSSLMGDTPIIDYFKQIEDQLANSEQAEQAEQSENLNPENPNIADSGTSVSTSETLTGNDENTLS